MSVVIAIKEKDRIYMGCDSQVTVGLGKRTLKSVNNFKIWNVDGFQNCLMGGVGNFRDLCFIRSTPEIVPMSCLYENNLTYPTVVTQVVPAIWQSLVAYGLYDEKPLIIKDGQGGLSTQFLLACGESLYNIGADGTVEEIEDYIAIGSGEDLAMGSLKTTEGLGISPEERISIAIDVAARGNAYVSNPIIIANTGESGFAVFGEEVDKISEDHLEVMEEPEPKEEVKEEPETPKKHKNRSKKKN